MVYANLFEGLVRIDRDGAVRPALAFGYAAYPSEGSDKPTLLQRTKTPRIRMV